MLLAVVHVASLPNRPVRRKEGGDRYDKSMDSSRVGEWWDDLAELNPDAVIFDDFDDCIVGYATRPNMPAVVVYDEDQMISNLIASGLDLEDAVEYLCHNTFCLWAGEGTPMIMRRFDVTR